MARLRNFWLLPRGPDLNPMHGQYSHTKMRTHEVRSEPHYYMTFFQVWNTRLSKMISWAFTFHPKTFLARSSGVFRHGLTASGKRRRSVCSGALPEVGCRFGQRCLEFPEDRPIIQDIHEKKIPILSRLSICKPKNKTNPQSIFTSRFSSKQLEL